MRAGRLILTVGALTVATSAFGQAVPGRTVQLIPMGATTPKNGPSAVPKATPDQITGTQAPQPADSPPFPASFRVHDLSRRWVEFEMGNSFAGMSPAAPDSAFSANNQDLPAVPTVSVPAWMRTGSLATTAFPFTPACSQAGYRPAGFLTLGAENRRAAYFAMMSSIACQYGIPVGLFDAMIIRESGYQPGISSTKSAFGLTQLMPDTAASLGVNRYDPVENMRGGARYLREQLDHFGQVHLALAAYNAGPGRVRNGLVPRIAETQAYVANVLLNWRRLSRLSGDGGPVAAAAPLEARQPVVGRSISVSTY